MYSSYFITMQTLELAKMSAARELPLCLKLINQVGKIRNKGESYLQEINMLHIHM